MDEEERRALGTFENKDEIAINTVRIADLLVAIEKKDKHINLLQQELMRCKTKKQDAKFTSDAAKNVNATDAATKTSFPVTMSSFLHGTSRIRKDKFMETFDYGLPEVLDKDRDARQSEVLLLYNAESAMPSLAQSRVDDGFAGPLLSVEEATNKCETLNIVSIGDPNEAPDVFLGAQCLALVGHEQMYHVQRFIKHNGGNSFGLVQRETIKKRKTNEYSGQYSFESDEIETSPARLHREFLAKYLPYIDTLKDRLKPLLETVAMQSTVIIMVCNKNQSSLLHNFACTCRAKGIYPENIMVFPTDKETESLAKSLGYATFFDEEVRLLCLATNIFILKENNSHTFILDLWKRSRCHVQDHCIEKGGSLSYSEFTWVRFALSRRRHCVVQGSTTALP
jgi:hypothetical protein